MDGDLRGLEVANFTDHDHVRILPQDGAKGLGKAQVDLGVVLCLAHARQFVFDRVFHRHDVVARSVKPLQRGIQAGRFARTRGACDQQNAMWLCDQMVNLREHTALHAHRFERQAGLAFVQQAQHRAFAMGAGQGGYPHIDCTGAQAQTDAAVLRQAFFGNVELGHDLQA